MAAINSSSRQYLEAFGLLIGMIIGAGIFGLPYAIARAGVFWGLAHFIIALALLLAVSLLYAEFAFVTPERHRFVGYVRSALGEREGRLAFIMTVFGYYGALIVYGILGGIFTGNIFGIGGAGGGIMPTLAFFVAAGLVARARFERAGLVNFYLTAPLLGFIVYLAILVIPYFRAANLVWDTNFNANWFLPYGVWLFALSGFTVIPEVRDLMRGRDLRDLKLVVWVSTLAAAAFSLLFAVAIAAATGAGTTEEALAGLRGLLGERAIFIGSVIGLLAVATSYIAVAEDFKEIFKIDLGIGDRSAWLLVVLPPIAVYFWRVPGFASAIGFLGAVSFGISGYFILRMSEKVRRAPGARVSRIAAVLKIAIGAGVLLGSVYEVYKTFI